jgi:hypothetical protein
MRNQFCCEASKQLFEEYYTNQSGNGFNPYYQGSRGQRGHGLGSILSGFFRTAFPILKRGLAIFGREALRTGAKIANDVADGESIGNSARNRVSERINELVPGFLAQNGSGIRRSKTKPVKKKLKRKYSDIFK